MPGSSMNTEEQAKAISAAEMAVADNPINIEHHLELGAGYFHADRLDEAKSAFQRANELDPNDARAYHWIGRIRYHTGPAEEAIEAYQRSIALDPHPPDAYYGLVILHSAQLGEYDAALVIVRQGLEHNPTNAFLITLLGLVYARMGRFDEALESLEKAIRLEPDNAFAYGWLSIVNLQLKRYDDMIASCWRELEIADSHDPRRMLGYVYDWQGRSDEAIVQLERSVALEPHDYEARAAALARVYRTAGRQQDADEQYALAHEMASRDNEYGQACFEAVSGNVDEALALLDVAPSKGQLQSGWARIDPEFAFMNDDPRFNALIEG